MPEILSQEEIDALLSNIDQDDVKLKEEVTESERELKSKKASLYDFKRPDKVSKEQIRAIKNLHDKFARNFSSKLSAFLRSIVEMDVISVDQMTYAEFVLSLSSNVSFNVVSLAPLEGSAVFSLEPEIGFSFVDRLLGGVGEVINIDRSFTDIEQSILLDVVNQAMDELRAAWNPIMNITFKIIEQESSPNVVQIVAPSELVVLVVFEVKLGELSGIINWCLPVIVVEPILNKIGTHDILSRTKRMAEDRSEDIIRILKNAMVHVDFSLANKTMSVKEFLKLKKDDILITNKKIDSKLNCRVNNVKKFTFKLGKRGHNKAVKLCNIIT